MPHPIGTILNQIPAPPYKSTRVALLYEILQRLGGNPEEIMSREWTPGNEGQLRPPYTSLTDALLYEIWMVIDGAGGGGGTGTEIIYYGVVKDGAAITPAQGIGSKIIPQSANYYIVPPAIANLVGNETTHVRLWIAEPATEPVKTATLWLRNLGTTFINEAIAPGGLMSVQNIGSYRVYVSEPMDAQLFNGQFVGPVFCSQVRNVSVSWGGAEPEPSEYYEYKGPLSFSETVGESWANYADERSYFSLKSTLQAIEPGDQLFENNQGLPLYQITGNNRYIVLKVNGVGLGFSFLLSENGIVIEKFNYE